MNLSFSPPEAVAPVVTTVQFHQEASSIILEVRAQPSLSTAYFTGFVSLSGNRSIKLRPVKIFICEDETGVHAENEELSLFGSGESVGEAIDDFVEAFAATWDGLKDVPESALTSDALALRGRLQKYIQAE